jgi:hypothetical protein
MLMEKVSAALFVLMILFYAWDVENTYMAIQLDRL